MTVWCLFCGGRAIRDEDDYGWMHAQPGDRLPGGRSEEHNRAGSTVDPQFVARSDERARS